VRKFYRIVASTNEEVFRGTRSKVLEKLAIRRLRDRLGRLSIDVGRIDPVVDDEPVWQFAASAEDFMMRGGAPPAAN